MKRILCALFVLGCLSGCASLQSPQNCLDAFERPSFFAQGETLAGFAFSAQAHGYGADGILQISRQEQGYEAVAFTLDGYRLFGAVITDKEVKYAFISKAINRRSVRKKLDRFFSLLLFPAQQLSSCSTKEGTRQVTYRQPGRVRYIYAAGQMYPSMAIKKQTFSSVRLSYGQYQSYAGGLLPYELYYQDGAARLQLRLLTLKK